MRPSQEPPVLEDDLSFAQMAQALEANIKMLREKGDAVMSFGPVKVPAIVYASSLEILLEAAKQDSTGALFKQRLAENFRAYEVYGGDKWGEVFITSYYEPVIDAAKKPTARFRQPIYGVPKDLVDVDLDSFVPVRPGLSILQDAKMEQRSVRNILRGRLLPAKDPKLTARVVAFPDRAAIEMNPLTEAPILAYADLIDSFFLEIQGSGVLKMNGGEELKIGYAAQNGYPYVPIGKFLLDKIPKEKLTAHAIETHLRALPEPQARELLNRNPSYVFFKPVKNSGVAYFGTEVVPGRTIATDQTYFPKGALAFLEFERPQFNSALDIEPAAWTKASRFVIDQDTGGAIRGPHRVDLFWGRGAEAKQSAGVMKNKGRLLYFVPKFLAN